MTNTTLDATGVTTSLTAKDLPTTLAFYRDILGFEATTTLDQALDEIIPWVRDQIASGGI